MTHPARGLLPRNGHYTHFPLHIGPSGLASLARGTEEQPQRSAALSCQLEATKIAGVKRVPAGPHRADAWAAQRLVESPEGISLVGGPQNEEARQVDAPGCGSRGIETRRRQNHRVLWFACRLA